MMDKLAQAGLFITGLLGLFGGLEGINDGNPWLLAMGLFPAAVSFSVLLYIYYLSYRKLDK